MFGKTKKKEFEQPIAADIEQYDVNEDMASELPQGEAEEPEEEEQVQVQKPVQAAHTNKIIKPAQEQKFVLTKAEMDLCVQALINTPEYATYKQTVVGQKIQQIIDGYQKTVNK